MVAGEDRVVAEPGGGEGEDPGAAAPVGERAAGWEGGEQVEREPGGRVGAGTEGLSRVDHDIERAGPARLPRRADAQRPDVERLVPLAPALLPAVGDLGGRHVDERAGRRRPHLADVRQLAGGAV